MATPVSPGDPLRISAHEWNTLRAQAKRAIQDQGRRGPAISLPRSTDCIAVKWIGSGALPMFGVCAFDGDLSSTLRGPVISPTDNLPEFKGRPVLKAYYPNRDEVAGRNDIGRFGIALQPIRNQGIGLVQISGVVVTKLDVEYSTHRYADVKHGDKENLKTHECGAAEILWKESGTGADKWAMVRLGNFITPPLVCRLTEDSEETNPQSVEIVDLYGPADYTGTSRYVTAQVTYSINYAPYTNNSPHANDLALLRYDRRYDEFIAYAPFIACYPTTPFDPTV